MSQLRPTFMLTPCPMCSSLLTLERPFWREATHSTATRKKACFILMGCNHAVPPEKSAKIRDDPDEWALVEEDWNREAAALLAARTEGWQPFAVERFCRELGMPMPEISQPDQPAQQQPESEKQHGQEN